MNKIRHLIVLMMENRSFDHYLGSLTLEGRTDVEGLPTPLPAIPDRTGTPVVSHSIDDLPQGILILPMAGMHHKMITTPA